MGPAEARDNLDSWCELGVEMCADCEVAVLDEISERNVIARAVLYTSVIGCCASTYLYDLDAVMHCSDWWTQGS